MINLLPDDEKKQIIAARSNVTLINYILFLFMGAIFLGISSVVVHYAITDTKTNAEVLITENAKKSVSFSSVRTEAAALRATIAKAKGILDNEVLYTRILTGVAQAMPTGVVLENLSLSPATIGVPITVVAYAKSTEDALRLKENFQQSPLFSQVSFLSLASTAQSSAAGYPITVNLSLTINKGSTQ